MDRFDRKMDEEFYRRIKHNFRTYLLLTSYCIHLSEDYIMNTIYEMEGYKRHKTVKYGQFTSHIVVVFEDEFSTLEAVARLNAMNCGVTAVLVDEMLRHWFAYEIETCSGPPCSLTIVDVIGNPPFNLNFLTRNILTNILKDFGAPYLLPYTAALNKPHMQVLFASMTEALAACIAFGEWYFKKDKTDCFSYRVRINPSKKEENLIKNSGGMPSEALKLDYFVRLAKSENDLVAKKSKTKLSTAKGIQKLHKQGSQNTPVLQINPFSHGTPILYFPIIATNCNMLPMANLPADFSTVLLNLQQPVALTNSEKETISKQCQNLDKSSSEWNDNKKPESVVIAQTLSQNHARVISKSRGGHRRATRIFEKRKL